jgi:hypothetical protein
MTEVDDIFAFALKHPDYLKEFLSGDELPSELNEDERGALEAAKPHIEEGVVGLLKTAAAAVATSLGVSATNYQRAKLIEKRSVAVKMPNGKHEKLYGIEVALDVSTGTTHLVVRLITKKGAQDKIAEALSANNVKYKVSGYSIAGLSLQLEKGQAFEQLAAEIGNTAKQLCGCV